MVCLMPGECCYFEASCPCLRVIKMFSHSLPFKGDETQLQRVSYHLAFGRKTNFLWLAFYQASNFVIMLLNLHLFSKNFKSLLFGILLYIYIYIIYYQLCQWPCGLRRGSSDVCLLGLWVRIPPATWMFVPCECCCLSGRGLCDGLITHPRETYQVRRV